MTRALLLSVALICFSGGALAAEPRPSTDAQIDYDGFSKLTGDVDAYRAGRLINLEKFQAMAKEGDTLILDARSSSAFARGHIAGAVNLPFTDFTAARLAEVIGDPNRRILIYCNNNFENNADPVPIKAMALALNIPTFINLVGYGYKNVFELGDVVNFDDPAVGWEKTAN